VNENQYMRVRPSRHCLNWTEQRPRCLWDAFPRAVLPHGFISSLLRTWRHTQKCLHCCRGVQVGKSFLASPGQINLTNISIKSGKPKAQSPGSAKKGLKWVWESDWNGGL